MNINEFNTHPDLIMLYAFLGVTVLMIGGGWLINKTSKKSTLKMVLVKIATLSLVAYGIFAVGVGQYHSSFQSNDALVSAKFGFTPDSHQLKYAISGVDDKVRVLDQDAKVVWLAVKHDDKLNIFSRGVEGK